MGKTPEDVLKRYDQNHRLNSRGFSGAIMDRSVSGSSFSRIWLPGSTKFAVTTISGYAVYRGREQQLYDYFKLQGNTMANVVNPVWKYNPLAPSYWAASTIVLGPFMKYGATY
jgi:hypothetical protein